MAAQHNVRVQQNAGGHVAETDKPGKGGGGQVVIKKYANRRLYNTSSSTYVTLDHLAQMVRDDVDFVVFDAKSGEDITRSVLAQIIFEEESKGESLLPIQFLRQLIGFYGDQMQAVLPSYLELSLDNFSRQQDQFRGQMAKTFGAVPGAGLIDESVRQNIAMFDRAMKMFTPFAHPAAASASAPKAEPKAAAADTSQYDEMKRQLDEMRAQIEKLAGAR